MSNNFGSRRPRNIRKPTQESEHEEENLEEPESGERTLAEKQVNNFFNFGDGRKEPESPKINLTQNFITYNIQPMSVTRKPRVVLKRN